LRKEKYHFIFHFIPPEEKSVKKISFNFFFVLSPHPSLFIMEDWKLVRQEDGKFDMYYMKCVVCREDWEHEDPGPYLDYESFCLTQEDGSSLLCIPIQMRGGICMCRHDDCGSGLQRQEMNQEFVNVFDELHEQVSTDLVMVVS
jgi:hypothetical protein